ncbi:MAG: hypothetical protein M3Y59_02555 [Myxococcota bacterium]|nr:hypothetical protein [Myxococcota bacterium]
MAHSYTMQGVQRTADHAVGLAHAFLGWKSPGSRVHDVQLDPRFQHRGVDLLWESGAQVQGVEVKGDRRTSGNYFLELVSNAEKDTPGCFLYSEADWLLYAFVQTGEIHFLPLRSAREWFLGRAKDFPLRHTRTRMGNQRYTTVGALVPVRELLSGVEGAQRVPRKLYLPPGEG